MRSFLLAFWEREGRRPGAALAGAADFLLIERLRSQLIEKYPQLIEVPLVKVARGKGTLQARAVSRRRALRRNLDPLLRECLQKAPAALKTLHQDSVEFTDGILVIAAAKLPLPNTPQAGSSECEGQGKRHDPRFSEHEGQGKQARTVSPGA
eukprot:CAMPEP_0119393056 /NCGR_PEP_ID=MMETSP1334-20130426/123880_1 /TAXON_ID=127549 /ORGANISM="Calcidiscus leptoporus, Strain RCC1130" /LENGTH=151 /DNA_ID=CAMNT_0007416031 /DNA_START=18 /DNA_END=473 /DNA_ORIENTATION=+